MHGDGDLPSCPRVYEGVVRLEPRKAPSPSDPQAYPVARPPLTKRLATVSYLPRGPPQPVFDGAHTLVVSARVGVLGGPRTPLDVSDAASSSELAASAGARGTLNPGRASARPGPVGVCGRVAAGYRPQLKKNSEVRPQGGRHPLSGVGRLPRWVAFCVGPEASVPGGLATHPGTGVDRPLGSPAEQLLKRRASPTVPGNGGRRRSSAGRFEPPFLGQSAPRPLSGGRSPRPRRSAAARSRAAGAGGVGVSW